ncbi:MAG TPA: alpha/beta hydrolase [Solirubrobacteraceae bacterium]|nr:alpha/beta hydrolase [Solirubrobacteraceae bacterium]
MAAYPLFALLALIAAGGAYKTIGAATGGGARARSGDRMIDVGGHCLHIRCTGGGSRAVILEPGLGEPAANMGRCIAPVVARTTTVCVYDRAGHAVARTAPDARTPTRSPATCTRCLRGPAFARPYVLAGHSLGGMFALNSPGAIRTISRASR